LNFSDLAVNIAIDYTSNTTVAANPAFVLTISKLWHFFLGFHFYHLMIEAKTQTLNTPLF